jgi:hypothetical protein
MEAAPHECKPLALRRLTPIIDAGESDMAWLYQVRDSNNIVVAKGNGFDTYIAAMAAGRKKARQLEASGSLPGRVATIKTRQDSKALHPERRQLSSSDNGIKAVKADEQCA